MPFSASSLWNLLQPNRWTALAIRFRKGPIDTVDALADFVQTRSAYVAQTSLYGYLKNRMGISYPEMFADETMAKSINMAKWRTYGACLTDLAIYAAALVGEGGRLTDEQSAALADRCFRYALADSFDDEDADSLKPEIVAAFKDRLTRVNWPSAAEGENAFLTSPTDLLRFAPIADNLKTLDEEIVVNSTRFRWRDIRNQLKSRIRPDIILSNFNSPPG